MMNGFQKFGFFAPFRLTPFPPVDLTFAEEAADGEAGLKRSLGVRSRWPTLPAVLGWL